MKLFSRFLSAAALLTMSAGAAAVSRSTIYEFVAPSVFEKENVVAPQAGLIVLDTSDGGLYGVDQSNNWVMLSGPSVNGYIEDKLTSFTSYGSIGSCAANAWCDLTSMTLPPGDWDISGTLVTDCTSFLCPQVGIFGVSTNSGNTGTGTEGNAVTRWNSISTGVWNHKYLGPVRVSHSVSTTYYLKHYANGAIDHFEVTYKMAARKVK